MSATSNDIALESVVVVSQEERRQDGDGDSVTQSTVQDPETSSVSDEPAASWVKRSITRIVHPASQIAAFVSLVLTAVMAWPAVTSSSDTRLATLLAEWTSKKEYFEFCESHNWEFDGCAPFKNAALPPPPTKLTVIRRYLDGDLLQPAVVVEGTPNRLNHLAPGTTSPLLSALYAPTSMTSSRAVRWICAVIICAAVLLCSVYVLHKLMTLNVPAELAESMEPSYVEAGRRSRPRSGGEEPYADYLRQRMYAQASPRDETSAPATGAAIRDTDGPSSLKRRKDEIVATAMMQINEVLADMAPDVQPTRRRVRANPLKRKLRRSPAAARSSEPLDTSADEAVLPRKRFVRVSRRAHDRTAQADWASVHKMKERLWARWTQRTGISQTT